MQYLKGKITFSNKDLVWIEINTKNNGIDHVAVISLRRVADFIKGEEKILLLDVNSYEKQRVNQKKDLLLHCSMICEHLEYILFISFETMVIFLCMY